MIAEGSSKLASVPSGGSGGGAAAASGGAAAGGAAEDAKEEEKVEGKILSPDHVRYDTNISLQRRRSPTRIWVSVFSIKRFILRKENLLSTCLNRARLLGGVVRSSRNRCILRM